LVIDLYLKVKLSLGLNSLYITEIS